MVNEGLYYIDIDSYMDNFAWTVVNQDTKKWHLGYFLMRDDPLEESRKVTGCGGSNDWCVVHQIRVRNTGEAQWVHVGAHVWQGRAYSSNLGPTGACPEYLSPVGHSIFEDDNSNFNYFTGRFSEYDGTKWLDRIWFEKDQEKVFNFMGDFANVDPDERSRDWSVTAWGTEHPLVVEHADGVPSSHSPVHDDDFRAVPKPIPYRDDHEHDEDEENEDEENDDQDEDVKLCFDNDRN